MKPYETFDHTADVGLRIRGRSLKELFQNAAFGLYNVMTDWDKIKAKEGRRRKAEGRMPSVSFCLKADNVGDLFLKWLRELLFYFSAKKLIFKKLEFSRLTETELNAKGSAKTFDPKVDEQKLEVKAVTYHEFKIKKRKSRACRQAGGWTAEVILDI